MSKFDEITGNLDNLSVVVKLKKKSDFMKCKSKTNKHYFYIIAFDGCKHEKITFFNWSKTDYETHFKELGKTYQINGMQARENREYKKIDLTCNKCSVQCIEEKEKQIANNYGALTKIENIKEGNRSLINVMAVCIEVRDIMEMKDNKTLRIIKIRDQTGAIYLKTWNNHFDIKEDDVGIFQNCRVDHWEGSLSLISTASTIVDLNVSETKVLQKWYQDEGKQTSAINVSVNLKRGPEDEAEETPKTKKQKVKTETKKEEKNKKKIKVKKLLEKLSKFLGSSDSSDDSKSDSD